MARYFLFFLSLSQAHAGVYSFGNGCASLGSWSQQALSQTQKIMAIVEQLKDDPNCKGIESILPKIKAAEEALTTPANEANRTDRFESIPNELGALRSFMVASPELRSSVLKLMASRQLEGATLAAEASATAGGAAGAAAGAEGLAATANPAALAIVVGIQALQRRVHRMTTVGLDMLDQAFQTLPNFDRCLVNAPDQALALFGASVKLTAAFGSSQDGTASRLGNTIGHLVTFLRNRSFTRVLAQLDESELWMSLSCLIETTSQSYCAARDAHKLLDYGLRELRPRANPETRELNVENPLAGYYVLSRDIPKISNWLQKIQFGIIPRLATDATFKNKVWNDVTELMMKINSLRGLYNEELLTYSTLSDDSSRRNLILKLIGDLYSQMRGGYGDDRGGNVNFFTLGTIEQLIPFRLIGLNQIPDECVNTSGRVAMRWDDWMLNQGRWQPAFNAPNDLATLIGAQLEGLIESALTKASLYFQQRMIVDMPNLVNESVTGQTFTVLQSLRRVRQYLVALETRIIKAENDESIILLPSIRNTRQRVDLVLKAYDSIREALVGASDDPARTDDLMKDAYKNVIETTYDQFNVLLQRDTFLSTRLATFIHHDYALRIRQKEDITKFEKDLMMESGNELLFRLLGASNNNPTAALNDLNSAHVINKRNLDAVEMLFKDKLKGMIGQIEYITSGVGRERVPSFDTIHETYRRAAVSEEKNWFSNAIGYVWAFSSAVGESSTYLPWMRSYIHGEIHNYRPTNEATFRSGDDEFGSYKQLKAKFCVQSLAFEDREYYRGLCRGSILKSAFDPRDEDELEARRGIPLDLFYDNYMTPDKRSRPVEADSICSFQTYARRNLVYWLTLDLAR